MSRPFQHSTWLDGSSNSPMKAGIKRRCARRCLGLLQVGPLLLCIALTSCGRESGDLPPDMELIRGEPIEAVDNTGDLEGAEPSSSPDGWEEQAETDPDWADVDSDLLMIGFDRLAGFEYEERNDAVSPGESGVTDQIPQMIRELDGREVGVRGFMLPIKVEGGLVREFLLMRDQSMCCFGVVPRINEWVAVTMPDRGVKAMMDQPITVFGTLRVGEIYEHGLLGGIYRMEGVELAGALDL